MKLCKTCLVTKDYSSFRWNRHDCRECEYVKSKLRREFIKLEWANGQRDFPLRKQCTKCRRVLSVDEFHRQYSNRFGVTSFCRECKNVSDASRRRIDPKSEMIKQAKARANKRDIEFDITVNDFDLPDVCPVLGVEIRPKDYRKLGSNDFSPTLDRIDNDAGYIKGNVVVVSGLVNRCKSNLTVEQLIQIADFYSNLETESK